MHEVPLPRFNRELELLRDTVNYHQIWRYTKAGRLPRVLKWVALNPRLARALADDADEIATKTNETNNDQRPAE